LIDNFSKVNEELQRIKKNIEEIKEMEEENISNINKDILNKKISLVEDLVKHNNLDYNQIKIAADKIETIKEETKEGLLLKIKAEASLIKYIKNM
jgi:pyridoxal biosynthesis lyase PdxS